MSNSSEIRVRIAPSPTGNLHIGSAHTALFNWLFAKNTGGKFILRIEDTDLERSKPEFEKNILEGLKWLGLLWDEGPEIGGSYGPYKQTERLDIYEKYIQKLLDKDLAYYCFCTKEELETERQKMIASGIAPRYNGKCRTRNAKNGGLVIRFKIPETTIAFNDIIRDELTFDGKLIGDIAIAKDLRSPLYNFAVVVDDYEMKISHIIRGEEHIGNTPKQLFIQEALGFSRPKYAHIPLMLDTERAKLSKRAGATALVDYQKEGYLPEAMINFLALMGWHPKGDKEIMSINEIIREFSLGRVQKAGAVFDLKKLRWMNSQYIRKIDSSELAKKILALNPSFEKKISNLAIETIEKIVALTKDRLETLNQFEEQAAIFWEIGDYDVPLLIWKKTSKDTIKQNLETVNELLRNTPEKDFEKTNLEKNIFPIAESRGRGEVLWPLRVALSGKDASPGPFEIMDILGKNESLRRIEAAIKKL